MPLWRIETPVGPAEPAVLIVSGDWRRSGDLAPGLVADRMLMAAGAARRLDVAVEGLLGWDSLLIATMWQLRQRLGDDGIVFDVSGLPPPARRLLALAADRPATHPVRRRGPDPLGAIGRATLTGLAALGAAMELAASLVAGLAGALLPTRLRRARAARPPRTGMQAGDLLAAIHAAGPSALPIIGLVSLLLGAILAFIGAVQLRRFAAEIFVSNLVGLALVRELGAVMTAIILAGRTGGANAARLATMQAGEEIDALRVFGIDERTLLVLPMTLSLVLTLPLLYLYACLAGIVGGGLVATTMLHLSPMTFANAIVHAVPLGQFAFGAAKSVAFALLIGIVSCQIGLAAGRSAEAVGEAATRAVVACIVGIIVLDSLAAIVANAVGL